MGLNIEIYSDLVCPWCFIGKRRLGKALSTLRTDTRPRVLWLSFELNPRLPKEGVDRAAYLDAKFGAWQARSLEERLTEEGRAEGIRFAFDKIHRVPNTRDAHRLTRLAATEGLQDDMVETLFRAYFESGVDIGVPAVLVELAVSAGLDRDRAIELFEGDAFSKEVGQDEERARREGVSFVPYFFVNGVPTIRGAEPANRMAAALFPHTGSFKL